MGDRSTGNWELSVEIDISIGLSLTHTHTHIHTNTHTYTQTHTHTHKNTHKHTHTLGRTPLKERSARRRGLLNYTIAQNMIKASHLPGKAFVLVCEPKGAHKVFSRVLGGRGRSCQPLCCAELQQMEIHHTFAREGAWSLGWYTHFSL
jgi:hypothetical protein